ncbi:MAG: cbb3-type cytochrome oxidase assembly protein CcoS [Flavobacteriales bacterium]
MSVIFILIIISLIVALGFLAAFVWAVKSGQFEDDYGPSVRILFDSQVPIEANKETIKEPCATKKELTPTKQSN